MKSKIRELLTDDKTVIIFDVDGVLAAYEYGARNHNSCLDSEWSKYLKEHDVYMEARPLITMQRWMADHGSRDRRFVCTTSEDMDEFNKKASFVSRNYPIRRDHIFMVNNQNEKLKVIQKIQKDFFPDLEDKYFVMVDDTVKLLTVIQENSNYSTAHISSFIA